jgi:hypothetical protein
MTYGFFITKDGFISHIITVDSDFFFTVHEASEIITLEIIVLHWLLFASCSLLVSK